MQRTIIYANDTTTHERAHAKRMARCALINAPNSEELIHMMARACTYQLTRMTDHTWTGCTCVKCSALLGSQRRGRDVSLTWNAWCPVLFCVSNTVPNNRRVWGVAADQTRVTHSSRQCATVCPSVSLSLSVFCFMFPTSLCLSVDAIERVCQGSGVRISPRETPSSSLPRSPSTCCDADIKHREMEREGDPENTFTSVRLTDIPPAPDPTGARPVPHTHGGSLGKVRAVISPADPHRVDFLEKVWKCPWVPAKNWQRCCYAPYSAKSKRGNVFSLAMFEPAIEKNTMLTDMRVEHRDRST